MNKPYIYTILLCAGKGSRTTLAYNKVLHLFGSTTILELSLDKLLQSNPYKTIIVCSSVDISTIKELITNNYPNYIDTINFVVGGSTRSESVGRGLLSITDYKDNDIVLIHDCARPFVSIDTINKSIDSAIQHGSGVACIKTTDTIATVDGDLIQTVLNRTELYNLQTPQSFNLKLLKEAYQAIDKSTQYTDDASVYLACGHTVHIIEGTDDNKKITTLNDIYNLSPSTKIGIGFDVHRLVYGRQLILGGILIPHKKGLDGHSDADVLVHAVIDAILSANNLSDIGQQFPDNDECYKNADSMQLLATVLQKNQHTIQSLSCTIIAQQPTLAQYIYAIEESLSQALNIHKQKIKINATTTENLGLIGDGQAIAASAMVLCLAKN